MANKLPWFTHDHDAHRDLWLREMMRRHGHQFHTLYWTLLELLHWHGVGDILKISWRELSEATMIRTSKLRSCLDDTEAKCKLNWTSSSDHLEMEIKKFRERQSKLKSNLPSTLPEPSLNLPIHKKEKEKENRIRLNTKEQSIRAHFVRPTLQEVADYCNERGNGIHPGQFMDHYEANGWKVGASRAPMQSWKAAIRTWERNSGSRKSTSQREEGAAKPVPGKYEHLNNRANSDERTKN